MDRIVDFSSAVKAVRAGKSSLAAAEALLQLCTVEELLSMLDGDPTFWDGLQNIYTGVYFRDPFVHGEIKRLGIPGIRYCDGPRGVTIGKATVFPVATARAATWDPSLEEEVGEVIGKEARIHGANTVGSACINLARHPAWGRVQEAYGEDPLLLGEFGAAQVRGLQHNVMACIKHLALNSMETARFRVDVQIDDAALHEVYLPHFKRCVDEGALSIMSAYNAVNGEWSGESKMLLTDILRKLWGFNGFVISDWLFGMRDAVKSVQAGLDIEAPFQNRRAQVLRKVIRDGELAVSDITLLCRRILDSQLRHYATRLAVEPQADAIFCHAHRKLAHQVAVRSIVLLKNEAIRGQKLLPLTPPLVEKMLKYALIGRYADEAVTGDKASSWVDCPETVSPFEALSKVVPRGHLDLSASQSVEDGIRVASNSDIAIVIVGYDGHDEGEFLKPSREKDPDAMAIFPPPDESPFAKSIKAARETGSSIKGLESRQEVSRDFYDRPKGGDRSSVRLSSDDVKLIQAVAKTNAQTVVCIRTAGAVIIEEWQHLVPAILIHWYNGSEGGPALSDVLFGAANPSGRLPWSMPTSEEHLPAFDADANTIVYDKWHGQRLLDRLRVPAAYPLGFGLSYTEFRLDNVLVKEPLRVKTEGLELAVQVSNTGDRVGRCVIQVYGHAQLTEKGIDFPRAVLVGFKVVEVEEKRSIWTDVAIHTKPLQRWVDGRLTLDAHGVEFEVGQHAHDPKALKCEYSFAKAVL